MPKKTHYIGSNSSCLVLIFALTPETFEYCIIQIQQYNAVRVLLWVNKGANASAFNTVCPLKISGIQKRTSNFSFRLSSARSLHCNCQVARGFLTYKNY